MNFVNEKDHLPFGLGEIVEEGLQAFLELAAKFCAGNQGGQVEAEQTLVTQGFRYLAVDDALRQTLDDGGLSHPRLADEDGVILAAPQQHLNGAANLVVATNYRVELALGSALGVVDSVFFQGLTLFFSVGVVDLFAAMQCRNRRLEILGGGAIFLEQTACFAFIFE